LLENGDNANDGRVEPQILKAALGKLVKKVDKESIDRFVRFLDKDKFGKVLYMEFLGKMAEVSNRDHNPFKSVVQRLSYFINSNKQTIGALLKRLSNNSQGDVSASAVGVPVETFAQFLKAKIDKKRSDSELRKYAHYMDIDKDGIISEVDLHTCISHLNSDAFFKNSGEALASSAFASVKKFFPSSLNSLSEEKSADVARMLREAMVS
jgi:Ca2+-binding EF-hand superfamily protein